MPFPAPDPDLAHRLLTGEQSSADLFTEARRLRDEGKGRTVSYSRKVFVPVTTMCRDRCTYCTFAKPPGAGGAYLTPDDVMAVVKAGERQGCTEALFTLGDRPEDRWSAAREFLDREGHASTLDYVQALTERVVAESTLFPHANPGLMGRSSQEALRRSNPSMGLMLENISPRLDGTGHAPLRLPGQGPGPADGDHCDRPEASGSRSRPVCWSVSARRRARSSIASSPWPPFRITPAICRRSSSRTSSRRQTPGCAVSHRRPLSTSPGLLP